MLFVLATPEFSNIQSNTTKVKVHLRNGVAQILDQHQDLMGKVENDLIEIETNTENKIEKFVFLVQDAVFIVSNKGLDRDLNTKETSVYVYAKKISEINSRISLEDIMKQLETKKNLLEKEFIKVENITQANSTISNKSKITSKVLLLEEEISFLKKLVTVVKEFN